MIYHNNNEDRTVAVVDAAADDDDGEEEVIDDWGLGNDTNDETNHPFYLFAQHEIRTVYIPIYYHDRQQQMTSSASTNSGNNVMVGMLEDVNVNYSIVNENATSTGKPVQYNNKLLNVYCIEQLTPIDMIDLGNGIHDATCHCVWTGAFLFLYALQPPSKEYQSSILYQCIFGDSRYDTYVMTKDDLAATSIMPTTADRSINQSQQQKRRRRRILELGCGTGIGSIGIYMTYLQQQQRCHESHKQSGNSDRDIDSNGNANAVEICDITEDSLLLLTMTDSDPESLKLCQRNCELNCIPSHIYQLETLIWGDKFVDKCSSDINSTPESTLYDIVFATDVLYDISVLEPLLRTADASLCCGGYFILSHIPRACYNSTTHLPPASTTQLQATTLINNDCSTPEVESSSYITNLNEYIIDYATNIVGTFHLERIIYPSECSSTAYQQEPKVLLPKDALPCISIEEMEEIGALVFIFQKKSFK